MISEDTIISLIRFTSGEIVVAEQEKWSDEIKNPITAVPDQQNPQQIRFVNWIPMGKEDSIVKIEMSNVVYITEASEALAKEYRDMRSPIITPQGAGKIIDPLKCIPNPNLR